MLFIEVKSDAENLLLQKHLLTMIRTTLCLVFSDIKPKLKVFILGKLSDYFSSFVFVTLKLQPRTCRVFCERYLNDRSRKSHGKRLSLSSAKFRAVGNKPTLLIAKFRRTYVSKRKFDEMALFDQRAILCL